MTDKEKVVKIDDKKKKNKEQTLEVQDGKVGGKSSFKGRK